MNKQRGILFTAPMVQANLAGIKTETRRPLKPQPDIADVFGSRLYLYQDESHYYQNDAEFISMEFENIGYENSPYGVEGDILYGRENLYLDAAAGSWAYRADGEVIQVDKQDEPESVAWAHHKESDYCSSIHMPKFASRIWVEITGIHVERLHDITHEDAIKEGIDIFKKEGNYYLLPIPKARPGHVRTKDPVEAYLMLYNQINGITMQDNPFNWVIKYKPVPKPKKEVVHG